MYENYRTKILKQALESDSTTAQNMVVTKIVNISLQQEENSSICYSKNGARKNDGYQGQVTKSVKKRS